MITMMASVRRFKAIKAKVRYFDVFNFCARLRVFSSMIKKTFVFVGRTAICTKNMIKFVQFFFENTRHMILDAVQYRC